MIMTRRQINNEKDRYGGYIQRTDAPKDTVEVDLDVDPEVELSFSRRTPAAPVREREVPVQKPLYSTSDYGKTAEYVGNVAYPTRKKRTVPRETEDVMPSIKTQAYMTEKPEVTPAPVEKKEKKAVLGAKTKAMLAVYVAAVVILAVVVIATGLALSSGTASLSALERGIAERNRIIAGQVSDLTSLENDATITGMATDQGMKKADVATEIELLPVVDTPDYSARTNWFDRFCDWLSKII